MIQSDIFLLVFARCKNCTNCSELHLAVTSLLKKNWDRFSALLYDSSNLYIADSAFGSGCRLTESGLHRKNQNRILPLRKNHIRIRYLRKTVYIHLKFKSRSVKKEFTLDNEEYLWFLYIYTLYLFFCSCCNCINSGLSSNITHYIGWFTQKKRARERERISKKIKLLMLWI